MIAAGSLNQRVTLQQKSVTRNAIGEEVVTWPDVATVWAEAWPLRGREFFQAQQTQYAADVRFRLRYRADVQAANWRVVWNSEPYDIVSLIDVAARRETTEILAVHGVRDGR
jgi:SPP1 family predicted phage head-tail adaptor